MFDTKRRKRMDTATMISSMRSRLKGISPSHFLPRSPSPEVGDLQRVEELLRSLRGYPPHLVQATEDRLRVKLPVLYRAVLVELGESFCELDRFADPDWSAVQFPSLDGLRKYTPWCEEARAVVADHSIDLGGWLTKKSSVDYCFIANGGEDSPVMGIASWVGKFKGIRVVYPSLENWFFDVITEFEKNIRTPYT
jgi:hypothetical protein